MQLRGWPALRDATRPYAIGEHLRCMHPQRIGRRRGNATALAVDHLMIRSAAITGHRPRPVRTQRPRGIGFLVQSVLGHMGFKSLGTHTHPYFVVAGCDVGGVA